VNVQIVVSAPFTAATEPLEIRISPFKRAQNSPIQPRWNRIYDVNTHLEQLRRYGLIVGSRSYYQAGKEAR
ncbi:hypothetical protein, partial [[Clostridium] symbiosum]|uniref:hypothetical protein n=1 Tax=Clostridium symbiosum TaxID=1512 RepID=UPI00232D5811